LDISDWAKFFMDITNIREFDILIPLFFDDPKKNIGLQKSIGYMGKRQKIDE
jgi:hypothetical protein